MSCCATVLGIILAFIFLGCAMLICGIEWFIGILAAIVELLTGC